MVIDLFMGGNLITGVNEELRRVYVGHRGDCIYFDEPAEAVDEAIAQWNRTNFHLVISRHDLALLRLKKEERCTDGDLANLDG